MHKFKSGLPMFFFQLLLLAGYVAMSIACQDSRPAPSKQAAAPQAAAIQAKSSDSTVSVNGFELYALNCQSCHQPIATSDIAGADAAAIVKAIGTIAKMSALQVLSLDQINAIGSVLSSLVAPGKVVVVADDADDDDDDDDEEEEDD